MTRMNPEWHKPDHDHPEGRSKMRWLVLGYMQAGDHTHIDAPTLLDSTVKMMVAMGTQTGSDPMTDEISTGDIRTAFLQGYNFDKNMEQQYVGLRAYPGAAAPMRDRFAQGGGVCLAGRKGPSNCTLHRVEDDRAYLRVGELNLTKKPPRTEDEQAAWPPRTG